MSKSGLQKHVDRSLTLLLVTDTRYVAISGRGFSASPEFTDQLFSTFILILHHNRT